MKSFRALFLISIFATASSAYADDTAAAAHGKDDTASDTDYHLSVDQVEHRFAIDAFTEVGTFSRDGMNFQGAGLGVGASYGLSEHVAIQISMSQTYSTSGGISALYTRLQSDVEFALSGEFIERSETVSVDGEKVFEGRAPKKNVFGLLAGGQQIFFNGTSSVVPGSGIALGAQDDFKLFGTWLSAKGETGLLVVNGKSVSLFILNLGIHFPF
jgi:hypothetical protein